MKILFYGLSSKFCHTLPSGWFLSEYLLSKGILISEEYHSVNENYAELLGGLTAMDYDTLLLSVYIFNVNTVKKLINDIRKIKNCKIIIGGPEADDSFDADHIIMGEGEEALYKLLTSGGDRVIREKNIENLDTIPSPYTEARLDSSKNKMIYYESSRGCPFACSYCMAGISRGVQYFSLDRVKADLVNIVKSGATIIKFTDRTFNANTERTNEILEFILQNFAKSGACFHFEVGGDLFKPSTLQILKKFPVGLAQMEAGVQTLNVKSLKAINRNFDREKFLTNISQILAFKNIHLHLDLIAGLPYETLESFKNSFNNVIAIKPHKLQLGFLKMLKGTPIRESYKAVYSELPPYEIIYTPDMSEADLLELKEIDWINERIYNSGKFACTLEALQKNCSPYDLFLAISRHFSLLNIKKDDYEYRIYDGLLDFMKSVPYAKEILRFDYLFTNNSRKIPKALQAEYSEEFKKFLSTNKADRYTLYEEFSFLPFENAEGRFIVKFDYNYKNPINNQYRYEVIVLGYL